MRTGYRLVQASLIGVAAFLIASHAVAQVVFSTLPDDFVLFLNFEDGKGDTITDLSQYGHDMALVAGKANWVKGQFGKAMEFDGATAFEVEKDKVLASFKDKISVGAWIKPIKMASWTNLVEMDGSGVGNQAWKVGFRDTQMVFTTYWVKDHFAPKGMLKLDEWQHVAYTYDGATAKFYINGAFNSEDAGNGIFDTSADGVTALDIGWRRSSQSSFLNADVDELWVSNEVKTEAEIAEMMGGIALSVDPAGKMTTTWGTLKQR